MNPLLRRLNASIAKTTDHQRLFIVEGGLGARPTVRDIHAVRQEMAANPSVRFWVFEQDPRVTNGWCGNRIAASSHT
jgi:hypothetical protein